MLLHARPSQVQVRAGFHSFAMYKLFVDLSQLAFYFGLAPVSMTIAAFVVRKGWWCRIKNGFITPFSESFMWLHKNGLSKNNCCSVF